MTAIRGGSRRAPGLALALLGGVLLGACHGDENAQVNALPGFVSGSVRKTAYDGASDDLLTAGLGKTGLGSDTRPGFANPAQPSAAELRRLAIYSNYRALVDITPNGGYGRFWGPNVDLAGNDTLGEARSPAPNISRIPTMAAAARTSRCSCRCRRASIRRIRAS